MLERLRCTLYTLTPTYFYKRERLACEIFVHIINDPYRLKNTTEDFNKLNKIAKNEAYKRATYMLIKQFMNERFL